MVEPIVAIRGLTVQYPGKYGHVQALRGVDLEVKAGETVGLVGESGSGKSTLGRTLVGLIDFAGGEITAGTIEVGGAEVDREDPRSWEAVRGHPVAMIFQDPMAYLNPLMTCGKQVREAVERHQPDVNAHDAVVELLKRVNLPVTVVRRYPHELSGGMRQRVMIAMALGCGPRVLIADEPTTALDVTTQARILSLLSELQERLGMGVLLISHDLAVVRQFCERVLVMYGGEVVEYGPTETIFNDPRHPYTRALISVSGRRRTTSGELETIAGDVPLLTNTITECAFSPRCGYTIEKCVERPPLSKVGGSANRAARCWRAEDDEIRRIQANDG